MKRTALLLLAVATSACTRGQVDSAGNALASAAPQFASDGVVVARVEARLVRIDPQSALHVAVASHDGSLRLSGRVASGATRARYVAAARAVPGVTSVAASLAVDANLPQPKDDIADFALAVAVRASLASQAGVNGVGVGVAARAGTVTLTGTVRTSALRATLVDAARTVKGVARVDDRLTVGS